MNNQIALCDALIENPGDPAIEQLFISNIDNYDIGLEKYTPEQKAMRNELNTNRTGYTGGGSFNAMSDKAKNIAEEQKTLWGKTKSFLKYIRNNLTSKSEGIWKQCVNFFSKAPQEGGKQAAQASKEGAGLLTRLGESSPGKWGKEALAFAGRHKKIGLLLLGGAGAATVATKNGRKAAGNAIKKVNPFHKKTFGEKVGDRFNGAKKAVAKNWKKSGKWGKAGKIAAGVGAVGAAGYGAGKATGMIE